MSRPADRDGGFTLLELLVSLGILALAGAVAAAGLAGAGAVWARGDGRRQAGESVEAAQMVVRDRLEQTVPVSQGGGRVDFSGRDTALGFLAPPPAAWGMGTLRRYTLRLGGDGALLLSSLPDGRRDGSPAPRDERLLSGVQSLEIAYFGRDSAGEGRWLAGWANVVGLPELVRVRVRFPAGDSRWWPELIVRPGATIDTACHLDRSSGRCRGR